MNVVQKYPESSYTIYDRIHSAHQYISCTRKFAIYIYIYLGVALTRFWQVSLDGCLLLFLSSCIVSCSVIFVFVFCYFCVRVLLFLRSCSVIFAFVFCYFCVRVLLFLCLCSAIFAFVFCYFGVRVLLFLRSCSVIFVLQNKCGHFTEQMWKFCRTNVDILQNTCGNFTEQMWKFYRTRCGNFTEQM